jgi:hypothetical protein
MMRRVIVLCVCVLALSGCDIFTDLFVPPEPPEETPDPVPIDKEVFSRTLTGSSNEPFAIIWLYRENFLEARMVLEAVKFLDAFDLDLMPPECLKVANGSNTGSFQWKDILMQPGIYERTIQWEQFTSDCPVNGTLFFTISAGPNGDSGSIPYDWPERPSN